MGLSKHEQEEYDKKGVKKKDLVHEAYYKGHCRNARVARWNEKKNQFYYERSKWGSSFIETLPGPEDTIDGMDYFLPLELEPNPEKEIKFEDDIRKERRWDGKDDE